MLNSDIRVLEVEPYFFVEMPREPMKFGSSVMKDVTFCHVRARVENRLGRVADGWGAILLSDYWAFPTARIDHATKDQAMRLVTEAICRRVAGHPQFGHPIDFLWELEPEFPAISSSICQEMRLAEQMPILGALVCASPLDAALHDAFGMVNAISSYAGYGPDCISHDLSRYLGSEFRGRYLSEFVRPDFAPTVPIFHLVGGLDKLCASDAGAGESKEAPATFLDQWIKRDGLYCLKVKLRGTDLDWDLDRIVSVYRTAREARASGELYLSADPNELCASPEYMVELLQRLHEKEPGAYDALLYIEQPTERNLDVHRFDMRGVTTLKPVVVDESLTSLKDMDLALELGWSGVALKTCKCHSMDLLIAARCEALHIPYTIQDLTNPGLSLLHSIGLGARLHPLMGVEANSRQYYPDSSDPERAVHPSIVDIKNGVASTQTLRGYGLGYQIDQIQRSIFQASSQA